MSANSSTILSSTLNNTTTNLLDVDPFVAGSLLVLYAVFFVVGLFGNIIVVVVVAKYKTMQTLTNKFIACLSASDIFLCLFAVPFTPTNALLTSWIFGTFMCKTVPTVLAVSVFVSTLTSVAIAVDRYVMIVHPHVKRITSTLQVCLIIAIWITSITISMPIFIYTYQKEQSNNVKTCRENWPDDDNSLMAYNWVLITIQLILPSLIITFCYTAVSIKLNRRAKVKLGSRQEAKARVEARRKRKINRMLIAMVTIFIGCWLPINVYHFVVDMIPEQYRLTIFLCTHVIAMSSVMYNPFLYGYMNGNFKFYFRRIIPWLGKHGRRRILDEESKLTTQTMIKPAKSDGSVHELAAIVNTNNSSNVDPVTHANECNKENIAFLESNKGDSQHANPGFHKDAP